MARLSLAIAVRGRCDPQAFWDAIRSWQEVDAYLAYSDDSALDAKPDWVDAIPCPNGSVFDLWGQAIARCNGDYVAVLSPYLIPCPQWLSAMEEAQASGSRAYVGPVEEAYRPSDAALVGYLVEYGHFHRPLDATHGEIPGTNLVVRRDQLPPGEALSTQGFSKTDLHRRWSAEGYVPLFVDGAVVIHCRPYHPASYRRRRYGHGRSYAASERRAKSSVAIALGMAKALLLPVVRVGRIYARMRRVPKLRRAFWRHFPAIVEAEAAWSAGEFVGYARSDDDSRQFLD